MENKVVNSYKDLIVWQKSMVLVTDIYRMTNLFPKSEIFGITSQIRRASVAIPSNIAEGRHRGTRKDFVQFLRIAYASGAELETQIEISERLCFGNKMDYTNIKSLLIEIMKMLNTMINKLKADQA